jgi:hypothetical protein
MTNVSTGSSIGNKLIDIFPTAIQNVTALRLLITSITGGGHGSTSKSSWTVDPTKCGGARPDPSPHS